MIEGALGSEINKTPSGPGDSGPMDWSLTSPFKYGVAYDGEMKNVASKAANKRTMER